MTSTSSLPPLPPQPLREEALYARPEFTGYSLWAVPTGEASKELAQVIDAFASRLGTPAFLSHMTVLAGVRGIAREEAVAKTKELAALLRPLEATIQTVTSKDGLYFQCVFGLLSLTNDLAQAHERAKQVFQFDVPGAFMPHISLIYGDLSADVKASAVTELRPRLDGRYISLPKLQLWSTEGTVTDWEMVAEFDLS